VKRRAKILIGVVLALGNRWPLLLMVSHKNVRTRWQRINKNSARKGRKLTIAEIAPRPAPKSPMVRKHF